MICRVYCHSSWMIFRGLFQFKMLTSKYWCSKIYLVLLKLYPVHSPRISHLRVGDAQTAGKCTVVSKLWPEMPFYLPFIRPRAKGRHKLWCFWQFHLWDSKNWKVQSFGDILWLYWTICGHVGPTICGGTNLKLRVMSQLGPIFCLFKSVSDIRFCATATSDSALRKLFWKRELWKYCSTKVLFSYTTVGRDVFECSIQCTAIWASVRPFSHH